MTEVRGETFREMIKRCRAEDVAEYLRGRELRAERAREERGLAREDRIEAAEGVAEAFANMLTYGLDNFVGIAIGASILIGGLWLAVTASAGG